MLEVAQAGIEITVTDAAKVKKVADFMADRLAGGNLQDRIARSWSLLTIVIDGLALARLMKSKRPADETANFTQPVAAAGNV